MHAALSLSTGEENVLLTRAIRTALACGEYAVNTMLRLLAEALPGADAGSREDNTLAAPIVAARPVGGRLESPSPAEPSETVRFGLDGHAYEIDLGPEDAGALRAAFGRYVAVGRAVGDRPSRGTDSGRPERAAPSDHRGDTATIRAWARANGHHVSDRGPIPVSIRDAYRAAQ
jgi:hypothetical protein